MTNQIKKRTSKKSMPLYKKIIIGVIIVIAFLALCLCGSLAWTKHESHLYANNITNTYKGREHFLQKISDNQPTLRHKNFNGTYHMIFYSQTCTHCQRVIPKVYGMNKAHHINNIQYRDITNPNPNDNDLATASHVFNPPVEAVIKAHHGKIVHVHKMKALH